MYEEKDNEYTNAFGQRRTKERRNKKHSEPPKPSIKEEALVALDEIINLQNKSQFTPRSTERSSSSTVRPIKPRKGISDNNSPIGRLRQQQQGQLFQLKQKQVEDRKRLGFQQQQKKSALGVKQNG